MQSNRNPSSISYILRISLGEQEMRQRQKWKCDKCGLKFTQEYNLDAHKKTHEKEKSLLIQLKYSENHIRSAQIKKVIK